MRIFTFFNIKRAKSEHSTFFFGICIEYNELRLIGHCQNFTPYFSAITAWFGSRYARYTFRFIQYNKK